MRAAAQRMALLIDDLLGLSRACAPGPAARADVDLSAMATSVLAELREAQPGAPRRASWSRRACDAEADAALLRVILANLLGNAWKFTSQARDGAHRGRRRATPDGERAFFVRDDGAGFDARHAEHLFGAFQRLHAAEEFEGDGIGLATVQRLVTRHGGRVWAEGEVEKGATFYFTLAASAAATG